MAIEFVGISRELLDKNPFEISGGEKRKVAIAGVIAMEPDILILDEPTAGLDPASKIDILNKIKSYHAYKKNTVIIVSHDIDTICEFANKIIVLDKGKLVRYDNVDKVFADIETLNELGLKTPQITKIFYELNKRGVKVNTNIYTIKQAKKEILLKLGH